MIEADKIKPWHERTSSELDESKMWCLEDDKRAMQEEINELRHALSNKQPDWLLHSAQNLVKLLVKEHYPEIVNFEVLDDLPGVLSQIDNITCGLERIKVSDARRYRFLRDHGRNLMGLIPGSGSMHPSQGPYIYMELPTHGYGGLILSGTGTESCDGIIDTMIEKYQLLNPKAVI